MSRRHKRKKGHKTPKEPKRKGVQEIDLESICDTMNMKSIYWRMSDHEN